jgi:hypothetical protein
VKFGLLKEEQKEQQQPQPAAPCCCSSKFRTNASKKPSAIPKDISSIAKFDVKKASSSVNAVFRMNRKL